MKCGLGSRVEGHGPPLGLLPSSSFGISGPQKVHACWALQACFSDALVALPCTDLTLMPASF